MNEEDRRRHDKSWNDPPLFTYDQLNQAVPSKVPLHKRYSSPPVAPEMNPGMRQGMYGQQQPVGQFGQPVYGGGQPGGQQWQQPQQQNQAWQPAPTPSVGGGWNPPPVASTAPYPPAANQNQPPQPFAPPQGLPMGQQSYQTTFPLGPSPPVTSSFPPSSAPVTSVTGSIPGSIPAPGFAPNIIGAMNPGPGGLYPTSGQVAQQPPLPQQVYHPGQQQQQNLQSQQQHYYQQQQQQQQQSNYQHQQAPASFPPPQYQ